MNIFLFSLQTNASGTSSHSDEEIDDFEDSTDVPVLDTEDNSNYQPDNSSTDAQQEVQEERSTETQLKHEIVCAICEALMLVDQMEGSLNDFEDVLEYAKKLFCRSDHDLTKYWPKNWRETEKLLKELNSCQCRLATVDRCFVITLRISSVDL